MTAADRRIIFLHIPRTGGLTLRHLLLRVYGQAAFAPEMEQRLEYISYLVGESPEHRYDPDRCWNEQFLRRFHALPPEAQASKRVFIEHLGFGIHKQLGPSTYITLLRDPVDRVLALHHLRHTRYQVTPVLRDHLADGRDHGVSNYQTRAWTGDTEALLFGKCTPTMLDVAKEHLVEHCAVAGVTELWDEAVLVMADIFGWPQPYYRRHNLAPGRTQREDLDGDVVAMIEEANVFDTELHRFARERFEALVARNYPDMERRLRRLRTGNVVWNKVHPRVTTARHARYLVRSSAARAYHGLRGR